MNSSTVLEDELLDVSTPGSARYGHHRSRADVRRICRPPVGAVEQVVDWFRSGDAQSVEVGGHGDLVRARLSAASAERLFATELAWFEHEGSRSASVLRATRPYSVPARIARLVSLVDGLIRLPNVERLKVVADRTVAAPGSSCLATDCSANCCDKVTPAVMHERYGVPATPTAADTKSTMVVAEFQGKKWTQSDLSLFSSQCGFAQNITVTTEIPFNGTNSGICAVPILGQAACEEAELDVEFIKAVAPGVPLTVVYMRLLDWAFVLGNMSAPPLVNSVSYGNDEIQQTSTAYMEQVSDEFKKLGARGVSILFASGDQGPCGRSGCSDVYHPDFPAASPYVTAVGGTNFAVASTIGPESAWDDGEGGFSNTFATPAWQHSAVASYKSTARASLPPASKWNASGRAYPDVSALAGEHNPYCMAVGSLMGLGAAGTSAATPVTAAILARLNDKRLSAGKSPLGFLNPWIFQNADAFHDVTQGTITGGGPDGFPAVAGFDAASGVGTPNYPAMLKAL